LARNVKVAAVVGLLVFGLALVSGARASIYQVPAHTPTYNTTLQTWKSYPGIRDGDLLYTYKDASADLLDINPGPSSKPNADPSAPVQFAEVFDPATGLAPVIHALTLGENKPGLYLKGGTTGATFDLEYTVRVVPGGKGSSFASVGIGADERVLGSQPITVVETLYNFKGSEIAQLTSTNGSAVSTPQSGPDSINGLDFLKVDEVITVPAGDIVYDTTNTYCQNIDPDPTHHDGKGVVPEPTTLVVWSLLGGVGLAYWRKRKSV